MPQSLAQIYLHIIFSTKHRQPFLRDPAFRSRVHAYLTGICRNLNCPSLQTGGVEDHVHILCRFGKGIEIHPGTSGEAGGVAPFQGADEPSYATQGALRDPGLWS